MNWSFCGFGWGNNRHYPSTLAIENSSAVFIHRKAPSTIISRLVPEWCIEHWWYQVVLMCLQELWFIYQCLKNIFVMGIILFRTMIPSLAPIVFFIIGHPWALFILTYFDIITDALTHPRGHDIIVSIRTYDCKFTYPKLEYWCSIDLRDLDCQTCTRGSLGSVQTEWTDHKTSSKT